MRVAGLLWRGLFLLLVAVLFAVGLILAMAASWSADAKAGLAARADGVETAGGVQQAAVLGSGPPVLVVHGAPGGYDQAIAIADATGLDAVALIAPSRAGYLGTPLGTSLLPSQQADDMAALLDSLEIARVVVVAYSSGVPAAVIFAATYPERVSGLVVISGVTSRVLPRGDPPRQPLPAEILQSLTGDVGAAAAVWMLDNEPLRMVRAAAPLLIGGTARDREAFAAQVVGDPAQMEVFRAFFHSVVPLSPREAGTRNDLFQFRTLGALPAEKVLAPTLVVHGAEDPFLPIEEARTFAQRIPGAAFVPVEKSGHLPWLGPDGPRASAAIRDFINQNAPR
jgi:pimeloyl-ACP methyl ester carboxylesterase